MKQQELTLLLCLIWILTLLYGEMFAYRVPPFFTCSWPHLHRTSSKVQTDSGSKQSDYVKVAVIADPQLMDRTSLHLPPKSRPLEIAEFYTDLNMRRSFFASVMPFKPDAILFLGDYFDGGPYLSDEEWQDSYRRFRNIFGLNEQGQYNDMKVFYIPGNHDIGYESHHSTKPQVIQRYEEKFGVRNYRFTVGKVDFIVVDSQTLDGNRQRHLTSQTWEFLKNMSVDDGVHPRVLVTHIPLYREDNTSCGPDRSSPPINQRIHHTVSGSTGYISYQNYVTEDSTEYLLDTIKPKLILSGHDHDQCSLTHQSKFGPVKEQTLGTISWQQGNLYPSFMLLSVINETHSNTTEESLLSQLCYLPWQTHIYIWYAVLYVLTILALLLWPTNSTSLWHQCRSIASNCKEILSGILSRTDAKEKDEDANYEYEMIWDVGGTMHLVKKPRNTPIVNSSEQSVGEWGNAVMRPTARKNAAQEADLSVNVGMISGTAVDPLTRIHPSRTGKSRMKFVFQRLLRTIRAMTVIAVVNVPLYMMLLFKDWD
ncbi:hypothetical protein HN51_046494 [Arachis hypogaea]|uniref:Calcineurin-like phosphoesterase domain-containing protein n=1 Tax=Arachis hypogaea TaxID=3818 RepID=A0A445ACU8_ARAHY|nr:uncharacterized protein C630.12 [Arachis ipaensis]XP_025631894.1 uncharacterized protein C630.12 [Arachis hypogaea]QHO22665.1 uncharacterized protein DS421_12g357140 [Arachis hypogaea]RYR24263.1 hypothetical protein Ahy_B02g057753 [Arachis hypogaea]